MDNHILQYLFLFNVALNRTSHSMLLTFFDMKFNTVYHYENDSIVIYFNFLYHNSQTLTKNLFSCSI